MGVYDDDPIDREDLDDPASDRVLWAQDLLNGHKQADKLIGYKPTYSGPVSGIVTAALLKAARDCKYAIGYPSDQLYATFGQQLYDLLTGRAPQTAAMKARAIVRKPKPPPTWSYPLAVKGPVIGFPYQGTHQLGNWQSDRGFDIGVPRGTRVLAPRAGVIGPLWGDLGKGGNLAGKRLYVITSYGQEFYLAHNATLVARPGQHVVAGQVIAYSNFPDPPHLHITCKTGSPYIEILGGFGGIKTMLAAPLGAGAFASDVDHGE